MELALAGLEDGDANDFVVIIANDMVITPFVLFMVSFPAGHYIILAFGGRK